MSFKPLLMLLLALMFVSPAQADLPSKEKLKALKAKVEQEMAKYFRIQNGGGKCLEVVREQAKANGGQVRVWDCDIGAHQKWTLDGTQVKLANKMCLQTMGDAKVVGTGIQIWACSGAPTQVWNYVNGQLQTPAKTCLQVLPNEVNNNGALVQLGACAPGPHQQWKPN